VIDALAIPPEFPKRAPVAAALGILSVALLGASLQWAHHWGPLADTIVIGWCIATIGSLVLSLQSLGMTTVGKRLAKIGLAGGIVSILALVLAGIAFAAGINPTGVCGGG
jgi:hypothetical protein